MASILPWSSSLCQCLSDTVARDIGPKCLYELHATSTTNCRYCPWFLQAQEAEEARPASEQQAWSDRIAQAVKQSVENMQEQLQLLVQKSLTERDAEQARLVKQQQQEAEEARIAKAKAEAFACRRCPAKYPSNTKLHEHIRDHHAKKPKPVVSNPPTPPHSAVTPPKLVEALPPTPPHSVTSSPPHTPKRDTSPNTPPKTSLLSGSAPEFVPKHSENASTRPLTPPPTPPRKPASMRPTPSSETPSKPYLTITDLYTMFAGKPMRSKLFASQNSPSSPGVSAPRQARITSYFLPTSESAKSTKSEASTSVYGSVKQSARASPPSRPPFRPSPISPSARTPFSTTSYPSPVCWRCQGPSATRLHSYGTIPVAAKAGIPMGRRGRRLFV